VRKSPDDPRRLSFSLGPLPRTIFRHTPPFGRYLFRRYDERLFLFLPFPRAASRFQRFRLFFLAAERALCIDEEDYGPSSLSTRGDYPLPKEDKIPFLPPAYVERFLPCSLFLEEALVLQSSERLFLSRNPRAFFPLLRFHETRGIFFLSRQRPSRSLLYDKLPLKARLHPSPPATLLTPPPTGSPPSLHKNYRSSANISAVRT